MMQYITAIWVKTLFWLIRCLPVRLAGALGAGIGRTLFYILQRHRRIAINNMARIYPHQTRVWRASKSRESFAELGRTIFELPHVFLRSKDFLLSRVTIENESIFREAMQKKEGVFIAAAHHSNWEFGALMFSTLGYDSTVIYRPMHNDILETYLKKQRERFGAHMISRNEGLRWLPKALKQGTSVAVMIDQHMSQGTPIPFLGHMANSTTMPAAFIRRQQTPVVGVALERKGKSFDFTLRFWSIPLPDTSAHKEADYFHIMQAIADSFTPIIHARPELWLWLHRRWLILENEEALTQVVHGTP